MSAPLLPPDPSYQPIAWYGLLLHVPSTWNLSYHTGHARQGAFVLSDLRGPTLEARWRTPRLLRLFPTSPQKTLDRLLKKLRRHHTIEPAPAGVILPTKSLALAAGISRLYELHFPRSTPEWRTVAQHFLHHLPTTEAAPLWPWSLYGLHAYLPQSARLRKASLNPGASTLHFTHDHNATTLGSYSLADRLLATQSLRQWAQSHLPPIKKLPKGTWQESAPAPLTYRATTRHLLRSSIHELTLTHHPHLNQIHWTHTQKRAKNI